MFKLTVKLRDREEPVVIRVDTLQEAYRLLRHFRLPAEDAIFGKYKDKEIWSISVKYDGGWWKLEREG